MAFFTLYLNTDCVLLKYLKHFSLTNFLFKSLLFTAYNSIDYTIVKQEEELVLEEPPADNGKFLSSLLYLN